MVCLMKELVVIMSSVFERLAIGVLEQCNAADPEQIEGLLLSSHPFIRKPHGRGNTLEVVS